MKALALLAVLFGLEVSAATSDILFSSVGPTLFGTPGNVVFDGQRFVIATRDANNDALGLTWVNTNGQLSSSALPLNGSTPRVTLNGSNYLFAYVDISTAVSTLRCGIVSNQTMVGEFILATNVDRETLSLSGTQPPYLAVWQTTTTQSMVMARAVNGDGSPSADVFVVASSVKSQMHSSVGTDGTNHLVSWMEENVVSNDWRVVARLVSAQGPIGNIIAVSQTNSTVPHGTACAFGTNYLVTWSRNEGVYDFIRTNFFCPMVYSRIISASGVSQSNEFAILRNQFSNTNVAVAVDNGGFLVAALNTIQYPAETNQRPSQQWAQRLRADGSRWGYPIPTLVQAGEPGRVQVASGAGRYFVAYSGLSNAATTVFLGPQFMADMQLTNVRYTNNGIAAPAAGDWPWIEISTNLVNWSLLTDFRQLTNRSRLFVRQLNGKWKCVENLRSIQWAKQQWAMDTAQRSTSINLNNADYALYGPTRYLSEKPTCPHIGYYSIGTLGEKPNCNLNGAPLGHTF